VHGICLGFELLHIHFANARREDLLFNSAGQDNTANTLNFTAAAAESIYFSTWPVSGACGWAWG
jgi:hypothetical protein